MVSQKLWVRSGRTEFIECRRHAPHLDARDGARGDATARHDPVYTRVWDPRGHTLP